MRVTISLLALGVIAVAQDIASLPSCAQNAAITAASSSGCSSLTDAECLCKSDSFISSLRAAITSSCAGDDQQAACAWGNSACSAYGVNIPCGDTVAAAVTSETPAAASTPMTSTSAAVDAVSAGAAPTALTGTDSGMMSSMATGSMNGMATGTMMSSMTTMTTSMMSGNGTAHACTTACGNMTHAATALPSTTTSGPTSQYTGAASTAARHAGAIGAVAGLALLFAFF